MPTHNTIDLIEFPAGSEADLKISQTFFNKVFGWEYTEYGPEYADTKSGGITSGINASENGRSMMPIAVIYSENLEKTRDNVVSAGGEILVDIYSFPGGRRFHFTEPSGNELAVWSE